MCKECGCGLPGNERVRISTHHHTHSHDHGHDHHHHHDHDHDHSHPHDHDHHHTHEQHAGIESKRTLEVHRAILDRNDRQAERNRGFFQARGILVLNILSSPGSGKTTLLRETICALRGKLKAGVIVGDLATDNDAQRLRESGAPVVQITTGTVCHLEAEMVSRAVKEMDLTDLDVLFIENVGNLVCPASYDLGEALRVVLLSVTEGEEKPLKYPPIFQLADVVVISKIDLAEACEYRRDSALANLKHLASRATILEISAKKGDGMNAWCEFLVEQHRKLKKRSSAP